MPKPRDKHIALSKKIRELAEDELGAYAAGGPAVVVTRVEWDGLTKTLDDATEDELGHVTSIVLHVQ